MWESVCLLIEWTSWSVIEMKLRQTGGLLLSRTIQAGSGTGAVCGCAFKCAEGFFFLSILMFCLQITTTWKTLCLTFETSGVSKLKRPLGTNAPTHPHRRPQSTRHSFVSTLEVLWRAWQQTRRRPRHPEQGPDERRGRATSREVNDQREAERKEKSEKEWEGSLQEQARDKKRKIKRRPRGCSEERRKEVRGQSNAFW